MRRKKGFTLVELLVAVVIIAVIALITTPVVMSIMKNSRKTAYLRSTESMGRTSSLFYLDNTELFTTQQDIMDFLCENNGCSRIYDESGNLLSASSDIGRGTLAIYPNGNIEYLLTNGEFCVTKYADESSAKVIDGDCSKIDIKKDKTPADLDSITHSSTTKSITATIYAHDDETGIYGYSCSIDGEHYSEISSNNTCYFPDLKTGTYTVYFKVYNGTYGKDTYNETTSVAIFTKEIATKTIGIPEYIQTDGSKWKQVKVINISEPNQPGLTTLYSLDGGDSWTEGNKVIVRKNNTNVIAKYTDGINTVTASSILVNSIDETSPDVDTGIAATTKDIYVNIAALDKESGVAEYKYGISTDGINYEYTDMIKESNYSFNSKKSGKYFIKILVYNNAYINTEPEYQNEQTGVSTVVREITLHECPVPNYDVKPDDGEWYQSKTVTINYGYEEGCIGLFSVDEGNTWKEGNSVTFVNNGNIIAKNTDGVNTVTASTRYIDKIDSTNPNKEDVEISTTQTTNSITIIASGQDEQSGIKAYKFSKDDGETWTDWQTSNVYTFGDLKTGTYKVKAKVYNGTYGNLGSNEDKGATDSPTKSVTLVGCTTPEFGYPNNDKNIWTQSKLVQINGSAGFTTYYSIDGGNTFVQGDSVNITSNNASVVAKVSDGTNVCTSISTLTVTKIDTSAPIASISSTSSTQTKITVVANGTDNESGITGYSFKIDSGSWSEWQASNVYTFSGLNANSSHTVYVKVKNGTYGSSGATEVNSVSNPATKTVSTFADCSVPTFTVSPSGTSWKTSRTVTIAYGSNNGCTGTYSKNNGSWKSGTSVTFTANGNVVARNVDKDGKVYSATQSVTRIDNSTPNISMNMISNGSYVYSGSSVSYDVSIDVSCSNSGGSSINSYSISASDASYGSSLGSTSSRSLSINPSLAPSGGISITASCSTSAGRSNSTSSTLYYSTTPSTPTPTPGGTSGNDNSKCLSAYNSCMESCQAAYDSCVQRFVNSCISVCQQATGETCDDSTSNCSSMTGNCKLNCSCTPC